MCYCLLKMNMLKLLKDKGEWMKHYKNDLQLILFFMTAVTMLFPKARAQSGHITTSITANEIVQRYIAARGGLEKLHAIQTLVLRGPKRPNGNPGREMVRARPFYFTNGAEGNDGSPWEAYDSFGLVARVTDAPAAALRHTAYFDDPLVMSLEHGWGVELIGSETIDGKDAYRLRVTFPDGWVNVLFVDKQSWLLIGRRFTAPFHAFGESVTTQTLIGGYRTVNGVLFPTRFAEYDLATGELLGGGEGWETIEANETISHKMFAPPNPPDTPVARLVNAIFLSRFITADVLVWYRHFRSDPATADIDIEGAIESVAYHCLKSGAVPTGLALLEENLELHPKSVKAHFSLGRAFRVAGREQDALAAFREALKIDPAFQPAKDAIASARVKY